MTEQNTLLPEQPKTMRKTSKPKTKAIYHADAFVTPTGRVLALDLASKMGYAYKTDNGMVMHGTKEFTTDKSRGQRWINARLFIATLIHDHKITDVAIEDVKNHSGTIAAHIYGAFLAIVEEFSDRYGFKIHYYGVGQIKKAWTGNGAADKAAMIQGALDRGFKPYDDNAADALAIMHLHGKSQL